MTADPEPRSGTDREALIRVVHTGPSQGYGDKSVA
jgi:hypothetical protein